MSARSKARRRRGVGRLFVLTVLALIMLLPVYLNIVNALLPPKYRFAYPPALWPKEATLAGFRLAIRRGSMLRYLLNSTVVSTLITAGQMVTSCLAAYAFTFLRFPARRSLFWMVVATSAVPFEAIVIGNFRTVVRLGWLDSYPALVVPFLASGVGVFLLSRAFRAVPPDLLGAAQLDGCGHFAMLRYVVAPVARPTIAALTVLSFLGAWGQYVWPLLVTTRSSRRTVQIGITQLAGGELNSFTVLSAGSIIIVIPLAAVLVVFQKQLVRGLTAGLVDG
jgi:sn-glycerol 3-phosphate transport system permease protein